MICKLQIGDEVSINYSIALEDGTVLMASSSDSPLKFKIGEGVVVKGWETGVTGMCRGEKRKVTIPPELGFGEDGVEGQIPPSATLLLDVELVDGILYKDELSVEGFFKQVDKNNDGKLSPVRHLALCSSTSPICNMIGRTCRPLQNNIRVLG
jgi:hypothetical protein